MKEKMKHKKMEKGKDMEEKEGEGLRIGQKGKNYRRRKWGEGKEQRDSEKKKEKIGQGV